MGIVLTNVSNASVGMVLINTYNESGTSVTRARIASAGKVVED